MYRLKPALKNVYQLNLVKLLNNLNVTLSTNEVSILVREFPKVCELRLKKPILLRADTQNIVTGQA